MESAKFRIYYEDREPYTGDPFLAPSTGVQVIAQEESPRVRGFGLLTGKDAYCFKDGRWFACNEAGMWDYLMEHPGPQKVIFGRMMVREEAYWGIFNRAKEEGLG